MSAESEEGETFSKQDKAFCVSICLSLAAGTTNYAIMVVFFPIYASGLGMSLWAVSVIFTAYPVGKLLTAPLAGWLASELGRKPVLIFGLALLAASTITIGLTPDLLGTERLAAMTALLIVARLLQGAGMACAQLAIFAILGDSFPAKRG